MGPPSREKGTEVPRLGSTAGSSTPLDRMCVQEDDLHVRGNSGGPSGPLRKKKRPSLVRGLHVLLILAAVGRSAMLHAPPKDVGSRRNIDGTTFRGQSARGHSQNLRSVVKSRFCFALQRVRKPLMPPLQQRRTKNGILQVNACIYRVGAEWRKQLGKAPAP
jgi:hypothetical protein